MSNPQAPLSATVQKTSSTKGVVAGIETTLLMLLLSVALLGVRDRPGTHDVPPHPYAADRTTSGPAATGGEVDAVTAGLEGLAFFCAQARSDTQARQV